MFIQDRTSYCTLARQGMMGRGVQFADPPGTRFLSDDMGDSVVQQINCFSFSICRLVSRKLQIAYH